MRDDILMPVVGRSLCGLCESCLICFFCVLAGSDFSYDCHVTLDENAAPVEYGFKTNEELEASGSGYCTSGEQPDLSVLCYITARCIIPILPISVSMSLLILFLGLT